MNVAARAVFAVTSRVVDTLPVRMWTPGNLWVPRWGNRVVGDWHCCVGLGADETSVRTLERNGRTVLRGRRAFDFSAHHESGRQQGAGAGED